MWTKFCRFLANLFLLVGRKEKKFKEDYPNDEVIASGGAKAIVSEEEQEVSRGKQWAGAKRSALILSDKRLVCGDWEINLNDVNEASIIEFKSFLSKSLILKIRTEEGKNYQFGLQYDPAWTKQEVLPLKIEESKVKFSMFSIVARLLLVIFIINLIFDIF